MSMQQVHALELRSNLSCAVLLQCMCGRSALVSREAKLKQQLCTYALLTRGIGYFDQTSTSNGSMIDLDVQRVGTSNGGFEGNPKDFITH